MGISFGSINTGLPPNIVQQLIEVEKQPIKALEEKKGKAQEQLKLVDDLTGKVREIFTGLRELGNIHGFADIKLETGDQNIITGAADKNIATPGSYQVEVMKLAHKTSAASNGFPDKDKTQVGIGYLKTTGADGKTREIYVDNNNNTLDKLAALINSKDIGVKASVVNDKSDKEAPYRLLLSGKGIGEDGGVTFPTFYFLDGDQDFFLDKQRPAENGRVKVDGFEFDIPDNQLKDVIPGVALDLKQASPGREINVSVKEDKEVITGKIHKFVDGMNGVFQFIQAQNALTKESDTTKTLGGDSLLRNVENRLRETLQNAVLGGNGTVKYLSQTGIEFTRNGTLQFDEQKFQNAVTKDLPGVTNFFVGDSETYGMVFNLKQVLNDMLDNVTGPLGSRQRGIKSKIDQFDQQIANKERIVAQKEIQLKNQFSHLEETMANLKSQGAYLQSRMGGGGDGGAFGFNLSQQS